MLDWIAANWEYIAGGAGIVGTIYAVLAYHRRERPVRQGNKVTATSVHGSVVAGGSVNTSSGKRSGNEVDASGVSDSTVSGGDVSL